jgi:hypothetical protein
MGAGSGNLRRLRRGAVCTVALTATLPLLGFTSVHAASPRAAGAWPANVFAVGTFHGKPGNFSTTENVDTIQAAVDAAERWGRAHTPRGGVAPDTYVLLAPGDYKNDPLADPRPEPGQDPAAVTITGNNVWLVGMNRNRVIIDGTRAGAPCSTAPADQVYGPPVPTGGRLRPATALDGAGLNGVMVWKASGTWVENLTVCNFLDGRGGDGAAGNEIWWNGGANGGRVFRDTLGGYVGDYLTATSTYFDPKDPMRGEGDAATYGIFSSDWSRGMWVHTYASNFNDSGYYIGACQDICDQQVDHAWSEHNALGYSGSNSGGWMWIHNSVFDDNEDGFDTNSQNGDNPPPQNGSCNPKDPNRLFRHAPPVSGVPAGICWVFSDNLSDNNNDPNVPTYGSAAAGPVGTGMSLSGARDDAVVDNTFTHDDAWGTILVPYPDSGGPCTGGTLLASGQVCWFDEFGDAVIGNHYADNGSYGNPTNGDIGAVNAEPGPTDCFSRNTDAGGAASTSPAAAETLYPTCDGATVPPDANGPFAAEVACDSNSISLGPVTGGTACPPDANYPRQTAVTMRPLPGASSLTDPQSTNLPTMPDVCGGDPAIPHSGLPTSPWCPR